MAARKTAKKAATLKKRAAPTRPAKKPTAREALERYARGSYPIHHVAEAVCACRKRTFSLHVDDDVGVAVRTCLACGVAHAMGDSAEYLDEAELDECACPCKSEAFAITVGVSLYADSDDVRWVYIACTCAKCGLAAVYADWKNEFDDYRKFLALV